jgi:hypothetical protein
MVSYIDHVLVEDRFIANPVMVSYGTGIQPKSVSCSHTSSINPSIHPCIHPAWRQLVCAAASLLPSFVQRRGSVMNR